MDPVLAHQKLIGFAVQRGPKALRLAMHAAPAQRFRADLLHVLRLNFVPEADIATESDVLLAGFCHDVGGGYYRFDLEVQSQLLDGLMEEYAEESQPRVERVAALLASYIRNAERVAAAIADPVSGEYLAILGWVSLAYLQPDLAAERLAKALDRSAAAGDSEARLQVSNLIASMAQPLVRHPRLLAYAAGVQALEEGRPGDAERLLAPIEGLDLEGNVKVRSASQLLAQWRKRKGVVDRESPPPPETAPAVPQAREEPKSQSNNEFLISRQEQSMWNWAAVALSIIFYFDPKSRISQCEIVSRVLGVDACANPVTYDRPAKFEDALMSIGALRRLQTGQLTFAELSQEIDAGRPVCVQIGWYEGGSHIVVVCGYEIWKSGAQLLVVADSFYPQSTHLFDFFPSQYWGGGSWISTFLVHRPH
jgi:hypothetical protein